MLLHLFNTFFCIQFLLVLYTGLADATGIVNKTIQLNKTLTFGDKELYGGFFNIYPKYTLWVNYEIINPNVSFIVFQTHSHLYNSSLSYTYEGDAITGTNIGLYRDKADPSKEFFVENRNEFNLTVYISIHGYQERDPIPGGCNLEFNVPTAPFLKIQYNTDYILCDGAPGKEYNDVHCTSYSAACSSSKKEIRLCLDMSFYRLYLPEHNFNPDAYFDGIKKMLTLENIQRYGELLPQIYWPVRRVLAAYPGTASVFAVVAKSNVDPNLYSVYVPAVTYACSPAEDDCILLNDTLSQIFCAVLFFSGTFVCYFGHKFFKTEMFLFGTITGVIITYILICFVATLGRPALLGASFVSGIFFGAIWGLFWWFYGIPVLSVLLPTLNFGFLFAAILYMHLPSNLILLTESFNFWALMILTMLITSIVMVAATYEANIICCAVLGAYAIVYSLDFYLGSNVKYIVINLIRRAVVPMFNRAEVKPPFSWNDGFVIALWVAFATTGFAYQHLHNRNRPPFPPPPRCIRAETIPGYGALTSERPQRTIRTARSGNTEERSPLLA